MKTVYDLAARLVAEHLAFYEGTPPLPERLMVLLVWRRPPLFPGALLPPHPGPVTMHNVRVPAPVEAAVVVYYQRLAAAEALDALRRDGGK